MKSKEKNNDLIKKKIAEEDKAKKVLDKKIGDIKFNKGINFSVNYLKNKDIESISFVNLKYKNKINNISLYYNNEYGRFNAITYELNDNTNIKDLSLMNNITKEYKLHMAVEEIKQVTAEYKSKLEQIDKKYKELEKEELLSEPDLELKKVK